MQSIRTKLTKLLDIKSPIVSAPMYFASTPDLAAAVTGAGGFGFIAGGIETSESLKKELQAVRTYLKLPANVPVPVGVGLMGWILDKTEVSNDPRIPAVLDQLPAAIWFAFGLDLGKYVAQVRAHDAKCSHKTIVFVIVNSIAEAVRAANEWKVDVLVVQGNEAGGHGGAASPPLFNFLQEVITTIPDGPAIIAAGGISTGAQVASLLIMGAAGVVLGSRFLFTPECKFTDDMKNVLLEAGLNATERSYVFDEMLPGIVWPEGIDGRAVANNILTDHRQGLDLEQRLKKYNEGKINKEKDRLLVWAGVGIAHVKEIKSAHTVLQEVHEQTISALKVVPSLLG